MSADDAVFIYNVPGEGYYVFHAASFYPGSMSSNEIHTMLHDMIMDGKCALFGDYKYAFECAHNLAQTHMCEYGIMDFTIEPSFQENYVY